MKNQVLVFSVALEGYEELFKACIFSQEKYCLKFNFEYVKIVKTPRHLLPTEAAWLKIFLLREALKCEYKWVAFIDADCEIRSHTPSFVQEMNKFKNEKSIFMANGFTGRINSGVIFIKNSLEALNFLEKVIENGDNKVPQEDRAPFENGHMIHFGKNNSSVQIIHSEKWNNNRNFKTNSFIQHYSGGKLRKLYLDQNPILKYKFFIKRALHKVERVIKKDSTTTMDKIQLLMPFYRKEYLKFLYIRNIS